MDRPKGMDDALMHDLPRVKTDEVIRLIEYVENLALATDEISLATRYLGRGMTASQGVRTAIDLSKF